MAVLDRPLRILFAAAEATPYSKVGGLADVAGSLPQAIAALGHDIRLVTPAHSAIPAGATPAVFFPVTTLGEKQTVNIWRHAHQGVDTYLVDCPRYFGGRSVYGQPDDLQRYWCFAQAVLELPKQLDWAPDVLHCHDWHTAPLCFGLRNRAWGDVFYRRTNSLLTIHNLRYRGPDDLADFLGQGIYYAGKINTVSPTYVQEILTPEYGEGLGVLLRSRAADLSGIANGLDYSEWNPATDGWLAANYDASSVERRAGNRAALRQRVGLPDGGDVLVAGMVGRLTEQKGIDLALAALEPLLAAGRIQAVVLGQGDPHHTQMLTAVARQYPQGLAPVFDFAEDVARLIYGGCDIFLMPSRFEPCGLGQLIAMRYGCVPVVRRTGGLADTVRDYTAGAGTGFVFGPAEPVALRDTIERGLAVRQDPVEWGALIGRAMARDSRWDRAAEEYAGLYTALAR